MNIVRMNFSHGEYEVREKREKREGGREREERENDLWN